MKTKPRIVIATIFSFAQIFGATYIAQAQSTNADFQQAVAEYHEAADRAASLV